MFNRLQILPIFTVLISLLVVACNGENTDQVSSQKDVQAPIAEDNFSQVVLSEDKYIVSLEKNVQDPQGLPVKLVNVTSLSADCEDPTFSTEELSFEVDNRNPEACYYEYTVQNSVDGVEGKSTSAESYVLITEEAVNDTLPPINKSAVIGQDSFITIDLNTELGVDVDDYVLNDTVIVLGEGNAVSDSSSNTITYTLSTIPGVTRLIYSMTSESGQTTETGYITVSVSSGTTSNTLPVAESFQAPVDESTGDPVNINMDDSIIIDVGPYTSDADGDKVQLTDVYSIDATTALVNPDSLNNTEFSFQASQPGNYDVSYMVNDHRGGYAAATVRVVVNDGQDWTDITLSDGTVYSAPWDEENADLARVEYQGVYTETIDSIDYGIVTFTWNSARAYCASQNKRLPTRDILRKLNEDRPDIKGTDFWPVEEVYWTSDTVSLEENNYYAFDLSDGTEGERLGSEPAILTCIEPAKMEVELLTEGEDVYQTVTDSDIHYHNILARLVSEVGSSPIEGQIIYLFSLDSGVFAEKSIGITDSNGEAEFNVGSVTYGDKAVMIQYKSSVYSQLATFLEDALLSFSIEAATPTISVGSQTPMLSYGFFESNPDEEVIAEPELFDWSSSNPDVATVDSSGIVTGIVANSEAVTITATEKDNPTPQTSTASISVLNESPYGLVNTFKVEGRDDEEDENGYAGGNTVEITEGYWEVNEDVTNHTYYTNATIIPLDTRVVHLETIEWDKSAITDINDSPHANASFGDEIWFKCIQGTTGYITFQQREGGGSTAAIVPNTETTLIIRCDDDDDDIDG